MNIGTEVIAVSPARAKAWLEMNENNRPLRGRRVTAYARDMAQGKWTMTGEAIKFDSEGFLLDGQHRLNAVIQSGVTVDMLVVFGLQKESQKNMDTNARRTPADALALNGWKHGAILGAMARLGVSEPDCGFTDERTVDPTQAEVLEFVLTHEDTVHRAADLASRYAKLIPSIPSAMGIVAMRTLEVDREQTVVWFESIANMATEGLGDPRAALLRRLATSRRNKEKWTQYEHVSLLSRCWNDWRGGRKIEKYATDGRTGLIKIPAKLV